MSKASSANNPQFAAGDSQNTPPGEPPLLQNAVPATPGETPAAVKPPKTAASSAQLKAPLPPQRSAKTEVKLQRRASDGKPEAPTIDNVRDLLLGDTIKQSRQDIELIERKTSDQLELLREEMGSRIDRIVRALSTVNQAVHKERSVREQGVQESAEIAAAKAEALETKTEDRLSSIEAKLYTMVADAERKVAESQAADKDKLVEQLAERERWVETRITELTSKVESQMEAFERRITTEIGQVSTAVSQAQVKADEDAEALGSEVGQRLGAVETQLAAELRELRSDVSESSAQLRSELASHAGQQQAALAQNQVETQRQLKDHVEQLEGRKVSRSDFSVLLQELATRLGTDDLGSPDQAG